MMGRFPTAPWGSLPDVGSGTGLGILGLLAAVGNGLLFTKGGLGAVAVPHRGPSGRSIHGVEERRSCDSDEPCHVGRAGLAGAERAARLDLGRRGSIRGPRDR